MACQREELPTKILLSSREKRFCLVRAPLSWSCASHVHLVRDPTSDEPMMGTGSGPKMELLKKEMMRKKRMMKKK